MRRFRSISDYLSLGAGPSDRKGEPLLGARAVQGPRPFEQRDMVVAERLTLKHLRDAVAELAENSVPPVPNTGRRVLHGYIDKADGGLVIVKSGTRAEDIADLGELVWQEPDPAAEGFGPFYEVNMPPADMTAICGDPDFQAGELGGEFRVAGKGRILVRPPMVAVDDIIDAATGKVLRRERNAIRLEET